MANKKFTATTGIGGTSAISSILLIIIGNLPQTPENEYLIKIGTILSPIFAAAVMWVINFIWIKSGVRTLEFQESESSIKNGISHAEEILKKKGLSKKYRAEWEDTLNGHNKALNKLYTNKTK
ncbi:hypothetical protein [Pseudoalteromonas denitrificans]|uniref:Uncharacterized protein n=1 Tax=Pseudoalteromonas denitrificans DSM 6059 TaxID=1123010 RepID=A0A1I1T8E9_9GAMM|nr:hypothetical protein [Pseudoalteromonas denitrificans]SFD54899.1 hypothetical protein SAMN02745724_04818 [Pseudoalteromonas denitrificans DSM 6059]